MTITVTVLPDVIDVWQCDHDITLSLTLNLSKESKRKKVKGNRQKERELNKETSIQALHVWHSSKF